MADKKVMVVHDDAALVDQLSAGLSAAGADVEVVGVLSAPRALGMIESQHPDVIIVDAELMGMDGYALTKQIKEDPAAQNTPVVIITLQPNEASALRARQAGAAAHLSSAGPVGPIVDKVLALTGTGSAPQAPAPQIPGAASPEPHEAVVREPAGAGGATVDAPVPAPVPVPAAPEFPPMGTGVPQPIVPPSEPATPHPAGAPADSAPAQPTMPTGYGIPGMSVGAKPTGIPGAPSGVTPPPVQSSAEGPLTQGDAPAVDDLLRLMIDRGGSDLHLTVGSPPGIRQRGEIIPVENTKVLMPRDTQSMLLSLLSEEQRKRFETELELDFAYSIPGLSRFRANIFQQRNSMGAVFRVVPLQIPTLEQLNLPKVCKYLAERPRGLVLVTGPTGSGKSTTLAAMIDHINSTRSVHIITLEDPIEFMHKNKMAYVNQREVGEDTHSFAAALKRVLRQDPDVILVGEMRDLETIGAAITAAETGHLVLATLHTTGGPETVDRIVDVFPPHQQQQVRMQLSNTLEGVLSQVLLRSTDGRSRVMAMEIMLGIPAIRNLIREGKTHQMPTIIQGGGSMGMQTLDQHLKVLLQAGKVTFEEAIGKSQNPRELAQMVGRKI